MANIDAMRQIRVGPESAGSEPGPAWLWSWRGKACSNRCGPYSWKIRPKIIFAGGSIKLDASLAENALKSELGDQLKMGCYEHRPLA